GEIGPYEAQPGTEQRQHPDEYSFPPVGPDVLEQPDKNLALVQAGRANFRAFLQQEVAFRTPFLFFGVLFKSRRLFRRLALFDALQMLRHISEILCGAAERPLPSIAVPD